jgi:hypothetical protein
MYVLAYTVDPSKYNITCRIMLHNKSLVRADGAVKLSRITAKAEFD